MSSDVFTHMQSAVDIVGTSQHPANKIAATLAGKDAGGADFTVSRVNFWPEAIKNKIGTEVNIGNSSGTVHAEVACILGAPMTNAASLFVTDPPCPNCVKNLAEAGVKMLYIDHKGFDKDFATRRGEDFRAMSMGICEKAGIGVVKIFRKEKRTEVIFEIPAGYAPVIEKPARVERLKDAVDDKFFYELIMLEGSFYKRRPFAVVIAEGQLGKAFMISAEVHPIAGFTSSVEQPEGKYNFLLQPIHRTLMTAARYGLKIRDGYIFSSRVPTAREQVNMVGAGLTNIYVGDDHEARDEHGLKALEQLTGAGILKIRNL
jgi:deoxycytidylate deaminase